MPDLSPGAVFAGHRIEGVAGRGGMGIVYRATHLALDHVVALKVISAELAADEGFRERFRSESRIAVSLRHPNVVPIHHAGEEDGLLFVTMDLIDGPDLRRLLIASGPLEPERAAGLVSQVASALDVAHSRGLVHRDIKPGNVLVEIREGADPEEHAYLTDFGLAKRFDASGGGVTGTGAFVGTLDYVAPEQIRGDRVDARTDVYALGCVLYESISGRPPFGDREENVAKIYAHLQDEPPWLPGEGGDGLDEVIARAMAKEPADRYPSAGDLARAATGAAGGVVQRSAERSVATGRAAPLTPAETVESPPPAEPATTEPATTEPARPPEPPPTHDADRGRDDDRMSPAVRWAIGLGLLAAVAAVLVLSLGGEDFQEAPDVTETSTARSEDGGAAGEPTVYEDPIPLDGTPIGLNIHDRQVSVATRTGEELVTISKDSREPVGEAVPVGGQGEDVVTMGDFAWVTLPQDDAVAKVSLDAGEVVDTIEVGEEPRGIVASSDTIWVAALGSGEISRIDPDSGDITPVELESGSEPTDIAFDAGSLWVSDRANARVIRIDAAGDQAAFPVGENPKGIVVSGGQVWVANTDSGTVSRLGTDGSEMKPIEVGGAPRGLAAGLGFVWAANGDGYVTAIDPGTGKLTEVEVGGSPEEIATGPDRTWVTTGTGNTLVSIDPPAP